MLETHDDFSELQPLTSEFGDDLDGPKLRTLLTFVLGQQIFAVDVGFVREVLDNREVRPFPGAPHEVLGMIDLRAETIPIIDMASRLGLISSSNNEDARIIVFTVASDGKDVSLGIVADRVLRVCDIEKGVEEPLPDTKTGWHSSDIEGLVRIEEGATMVLQIKAVLFPNAEIAGEFDFE